MTNESPLTLFPVEPPAAPKSEFEPDKAGRIIWARPKPAASQAPHREARAKPLAREPRHQNAQGVNGSPDPLLTVEEFADQLRVTRACVRKWILTRRVGVVKIGRLVRLRSSELRRIVDEGSRPRAEPR
jgi:excisionase family DNA binding protein